jgi:hypothetical protein
VAFPADGPWRGEVHRLADRPAALSRLLEEAAAAGMEQALIVTAAAEPGGPHDLQPPRLDPSGRAGEWLAAQEASAVRDAIRYAQAHFHAVFVIRPQHNPLLPLDLAGADDLIAAEESALGHLNADHADALRLYAAKLDGQPEARWHATGLDPEGLDLAAGDRTSRIAFPSRIATADALRGILVALARQARAAGSQSSSPM